MNSLMRDDEYPDTVDNLPSAPDAVAYVDVNAVVDVDDGKNAMFLRVKEMV